MNETDSGLVDIENQKSRLYITNSEEDVKKDGIQSIIRTPLKQPSKKRKLSTLDKDENLPSLHALRSGAVYSEQAVLQKIVQLGPRHPDAYLEHRSVWHRMWNKTSCLQDVVFDCNTAASIAADPGYRHKIERTVAYFDERGIYPEMSELLKSLCECSDVAARLASALESSRGVDENGVLGALASSYVDQKRLSAPWHDSLLEWIDAIERAVSLQRGPLQQSPPVTVSSFLS